MLKHMKGSNVFAFAFSCWPKHQWSWLTDKALEHPLNIYIAVCINLHKVDKMLILFLSRLGSLLYIYIYIYMPSLYDNHQAFFNRPQLLLQMK